MTSGARQAISGGPVYPGNMPTRRNSTIEVLRIVAMVAIVAHHYAVHGGVMVGTNSAGTGVALSVISGFGKWGVNLFVLVGAYFMVERATRGRALANIFSQVLPISWIILGLTAVFAFDTLTPGAAKASIMPVIFSQYWFVTAYVMLVLIGPYLAMLARALTQKQLGRLIMVGVVLWSLLITVDGVWLSASNLGWFALLFMIAAYIRLHPIPGSRAVWSIAALASVAVIFFGLLAFTAYRWATVGDASGLAWPREILAGEYSPLALASAVCVLVAAFKAPPTLSPKANYWASAAFGVYLIHDHSLVRRWLWTDWVDTTSAAGHWWLPLHAFVAVLVVYVGASLIIVALRPVVLDPSLRVATAIRKRVEARLAEPEESDPGETPHS